MLRQASHDKKYHLNVAYNLGAVYKGRPANGEGGGFEIPDIPGGGGL